MTARAKLWWSLTPTMVIVAVAIIAPAFAADAEPATGVPFATPSAAHLLGTDSRSRDVLSELLRGGWGLMLLATVIALAVTALASVLGAIAALREPLGNAIRWIADAFMLVPPVLAVLLILLSWPSGGPWALVVVAVIIGTPYTTRVIAAAAAPVAASGYVQVADASGESLAWLVFGEVLPNMRRTLANQFGLRFVEAIYLVSTAAFLQLPTTMGGASWAVMVRENASGILLNPWSVVAPAAAIAVLAIGVNLAVLAGGARSVDAAAVLR